MRSPGPARYAALALLSALVHASTPSDWVPVRWQGGPLEAARRELADSASKRSAILDWYSSDTLDLLKDTPVNSILVTWAIGGRPEIESRQRLLVTAYSEAAHKRGIAVIGLVYAGADAQRAIADAVESRLDGLAFAGGFPDATTAARLAQRRGLRTVALGSPDWLAGDNVWDILGSDSGVTPGIVAFRDGAVRASTTTEPWIASNTWFVRSLRDRTGKRPVWLGYSLEQWSTTDYLRAIADAAVAGGRWVVTPDDSLMRGLLRHSPDALQMWRDIMMTLRFYTEHADWDSLTPAAVAGIIYDVNSTEPDTQSEYLNLVMRRRIPYRVIDRAALGSTSLDGLQALLTTTLPKPTNAERSQLLQFAKKGGVIVAGPSGTSPPGALTYKEEWPDPELVAKDLAEVIGSDHLPARLFNASSFLAQIAADNAASMLVVRMVNYANAPSGLLTVRVNRPHGVAWLFRPGLPPAELEVRRSGQRTEVQFNDIAVSAAVVFRK